MSNDYFMSGKFYINGDNGKKVLTGYFSTIATSGMNTTDTFNQMLDAVVSEHNIDPKMVCVEQFNKV